MGQRSQIRAQALPFELIESFKLAKLGPTYLSKSCMMMKLSDPTESPCWTA
jgi:hypothetical protein